MQLKLKSGIDSGVFGDLNSCSSAANDIDIRSLTAPFNIMNNELRPDENVQQIWRVKDGNKDISDAQKDDDKSPINRGFTVEFEPYSSEKAKQLISEKTQEIGNRDLCNPKEKFMTPKNALDKCRSVNTDDALKVGMTAKSKNNREKKVQVHKKDNPEERTKEGDIEEANKDNGNEERLEGETQNLDGDNDVFSAKELLGFAWQIAKGMVSTALKGKKLRSSLISNGDRNNMLFPQKTPFFT